MQQDGRKHMSRWATILFAVGLTALAVYAADLLLLGFLGILIAVFLRALTDPLARWLKCPENLALWLVVVLLFLGWLAGGWFFAAEVSKQTDELAEKIPLAVDNLRQALLASDWGNQVITYLSRLEKFQVRPGMLSQATSVLTVTFGALASLGIMLIMGFFLAYSPREYVGYIIRLVRPERRTRIADVMGQLGESLRWWTIGKTISMFAIGFMTFVGLKIIGIQLALVLAILAGLLSFIPYWGPALSAAPALLLALLESPTSVAWVAILFAVVQFVEGNLLTPFVERRSVQLPPAFTIFCQVFFGVMFGFLGVLLASPLAVVLVVLVRTLYVEDYLESGLVTPEGS